MVILEKLSKISADDAVVNSFLYYWGIGVLWDFEKAKKILNNSCVNSNGRALLLKYCVNGG